MGKVHSAGLPPPSDVPLLLGEPPFPNEKDLYLTTIDTIIAIGELWDAEALIPGPFDKCRGRGAGLAGCPWDPVPLAVPMPEPARLPGLRF